MKRYNNNFNNNGKSVWRFGVHPDLIRFRMVHRAATNRRSVAIVEEAAGPFDDMELENRPHDDLQPSDSVNLKLDRLMDRFDKLDSWCEETDRRFENLDLMVTRGNDEFYADD